MVAPIPRVQVPTAATKGEIFQVKALISHQMETGLRHDSEGKVIDVNSRPKSLMETFRNVHQNGADRDPKTGYVKQL